MARKFNLQPWRAQKREQQKTQFITICAVIALVCAGLFGGYHLLYKNYLESQGRAIQSLESQIGAIKYAEEKVQKAKKLNEDVTKQINAIQELEAQRGLTVRILNYLAENVPQIVFLESVNYKDNFLTISGVAENEIGVSSLIRNLEPFPYFANVTLIKMNQAKDSARYTLGQETDAKSFTLVVRVIADVSSSAPRSKS